MLRSPRIISELKRALAQAGSREIGGLLLENATGRQRIHLSPNLASAPGVLEVPGWWLRRMLNRKDESGLTPVAFFHSHSDTLEPSHTDLESMSSLRLPWIILRYRGDDLTWITLNYK